MATPWEPKRYGIVSTAFDGVFKTGVIVVMNMKQERAEVEFRLGENNLVTYRVPLPQLARATDEDAIVWLLDEFDAEPGVAVRVAEENDLTNAFLDVVIHLRESADMKKAISAILKATKTQVLNVQMALRFVNRYYYITSLWRRI